MPQQQHQQPYQLGQNIINPYNPRGNQENQPALPNDDEKEELTLSKEDSNYNNNENKKEQKKDKNKNKSRDKDKIKRDDKNRVLPKKRTNAKGGEIDPSDENKENDNYNENKGDEIELVEEKELWVGDNHKYKDNNNKYNNNNDSDNDEAIKIDDIIDSIVTIGGTVASVNASNQNDMIDPFIPVSNWDFIHTTCWRDWNLDELVTWIINIEDDKGLLHAFFCVKKNGRQQHEITNKKREKKLSGK